MTHASNSDPLRLPETFGVAPLRLSPESESIGMGGVVFEALLKHFGTVKALAFALGGVDPSQARAEIKSGDFRRLDKHADHVVRQVVSDAMKNAYGPLRSPEDHADACIHQVQKLLTDIAQYIASNRRTA